MATIRNPQYDDIWIIGEEGKVSIRSNSLIEIDVIRDDIIRLRTIDRGRHIVRFDNPQDQVKFLQDIKLVRN
jgi:hypothetical protein